MKKSLTELLPFLKANEQSMVAQLHQFCDINSGSYHLAGLQTMLNALRAAFTPIADDIELRKLPPVQTINMAGNASTHQCGDMLFIRKRPHLKNRILLSGHMDTVYGPEHPFQKLVYINDNHVNGPGVADMKGGLIVMIHALTAFETTLSATKLGWDVLINADEEIGSPASAPVFAEIAPHYQAALLYEPAMTTTGMMAKNRKGSGKITLIAKGKSAHAGRNFYEGRNAVCYLAEIILTIHKLNGNREGVTINVGKVAGGDALNVVPDLAVAKLDVRITHPDDEFWVRDQINQILHQHAREGFALSVEGGFGRPVKRVNKATQQLFQRIKKVGKELGLDLDWQDSGGCCDGNNLAHQGLAVLDTLGVRGGEIHSAAEFILLDSLIERAALSTLLMIDLAQNGFNGA